MPYRDEKHPIIFEESVKILGEEYVEDDPSIVEAVYRDANTSKYAAKGRFEFIVLPACTEDVQNIMKLANHLKFPTSTTGSGMQQVSFNAVEGYPHWCFLDAKRMDRIEIDPNNMYAIIEPYTTIARLAESAYRCTMCRRCTQACARGIDNGLITHELRKLFSQELGIAPKELHEAGTVKQLKVGASTGISPKAFEGIIEFMEEEIEEKTGKKIRIPVNKRGADILLIHNTGEYMSWPENPIAFAIIFDAAGINWTLSTEIGGYEGTNYGLWYDDSQFARIALKHAQIAKDLRVKKIVIGECGHAHKAAIVTSDRLYPPELNIPRESCMPVLEEIVFSGKLKLDPQRNNFPVTLHDPCNLVRSMGIVEPQRRIMRAICPQFREMAPHGVENYCCGGGSGFAIMQSMNFPEWRSCISGRMKMKQIIDAFQDELDPSIPKVVCTPCSNCKGQIRDMFSYYNIGEQYNITYTGLVEFIVNAMVDMPVPFLEVEEVPVVEEATASKEALKEML